MMKKRDDHSGAKRLTPDNIYRALENDLLQLKAKQLDELAKIHIQEAQGLQRSYEVELWLSKVTEILPRVSALLDSKDVESPSFCGLGSKNYIPSLGYYKMLVKTWEEIESLRSTVFGAVAYSPARVLAVPPIPLTTSHEKLFEEAWNYLMKDEVGIVGLHGMGGVGKTAILIQINNRFLKANGFEVVIWVVVSKDLHIKDIQESIGIRIGLCDKKWKQKTELEKANNIYTALMRKRFVLLLDDIWREVPLREIGVPSPTRENGCKVMFTTRCKKVCHEMEVNAMVKVECLSPDDAWDLFQEQVGETALKNHEDIPQLAREVAKKCGNLPLALHVIGNAMTSKITVPQWRCAIDVLNSSSHKFRGMKDEILPILKLSYDNLRNEKIKSCFLYCALFPEDREIDEEVLIDQWICEELITEDEDRNVAMNEGHDIIATLADAYLLMGVEIRDTVKMHYVIRKMALWILSELGNQKKDFFLKAGERLRQRLGN